MSDTTDSTDTTTGPDSTTEPPQNETAAARRRREAEEAKAAAAAAALEETRLAKEAELAATNAPGDGALTNEDATPYKLNANVSGVGRAGQVVQLAADHYAVKGGYAIPIEVTSPGGES